MLRILIHERSLQGACYLKLMLTRACKMRAQRERSHSSLCCRYPVKYCGKFRLHSRDTAAKVFFLMFMRYEQLFRCNFHATG